jgi:hypothetical protein
VTANPNAAWVTQQARNLMLTLKEQGHRVRFLLHDRDAKFTRAFDEVFRSEGADVLRTPVQTPNANAHAERWVRTVRTECLDWLLIVGRAHLDRILRVYVQHYNQHRPHRALRLESPDPADPRIFTRAIQSRCSGATCSAGCFMSINELHERICVPYAFNFLPCAPDQAFLLPSSACPRSRYGPGLIGITRWGRQGQCSGDRRAVARRRPDRGSYAVPSGWRPSSRRTILVPATRLRSLRKATSRAS